MRRYGGRIRARRHFKQAIKVYRPFHLRYQRLKPFVRHRPLHGRHKPKVALRRFEVVAAGQVANHGQTGSALYGRLAEVQVARTAYAVKYDTGYVHIRIEALKAQHFGGDAAPYAGGVGNQHHRGVQKLGDLCGGSLLRQVGVAVVQPHHAFHDSDVAALRRPAEQLQRGVVRQQPCVQVAA